MVNLIITDVASVNSRNGSSANCNVVINRKPVTLSAEQAPSFRNTLSAGGRNTLALAFFFASLEREPAIANKIVVIDDPMESLDEHRSLTTVYEMRLLCARMGKLGFELDILADYILAGIKKAERIFADETMLPTLAPGFGSAKTAWLLAYARDDRPFGRNGPPMVAYRFEGSCACDWVARHLSGYRGNLQVDGHGA